MTYFKKRYIFFQRLVSSTGTKDNDKPRGESEKGLSASLLIYT